MRTSRLLCETHIAKSVCKECSHEALFLRGHELCMLFKTSSSGSDVHLWQLDALLLAI